MTARAIWKGTIRADGVTVPVKLYSAVQDRNIRFHLLHDQDMVRVKQRMVNPETGDTVSPDEIRKGYQFERGRFVLLSDEELEQMVPPASRDITLTRFVPSKAIHHQWYDRPYYLGPDNSESDYFAFSEAMEKSGQEAVAQWVMRKKQYLGALRSQGGYLMLLTLRYANQIIPASELQAPSGGKLDDKELNMAQQLVDMLAADFDPSEFRDEYRQRVRELIKTKQSGGKIKIEKPPKRPKQKSLSEVLQASLQAVEK